MRVLVVGSGAREHSIVLALAQDPQVTALACAPGNAGTVAVAEQRGLDVGDPAAVAALALDWEADLVVIGAEAPLVAGVADAVRAAGVACFGPTAEAARIEGSKTFAKDVDAAGTAAAASGQVGAQGSTETRQDADFLTAQGRASVFDEALKGSILSPATWRQASSAVRQKR